MKTVSSDAAEAKARLAEAIRSERRAVLVVNTRSRSGARSYAQAKQLLLERGFVLDQDYPVRDASRMGEVIAHALQDNPSLVIVGGGDGTISSVVDAFAYKDVVLGLLPLGTANSFARTLGVPLDLPGAVGVIASGKVVDVDLGKAGDDYFANAAAIGLPAAIARSAPHLLKRFLGRASYVLVGGVKLLKFKPFACEIRFGDGRIERFDDVLDLRVANGPFKGGVLATPEASVENGELVVHMMRGRSSATIARVWAKIAAGVTPSEADVHRIHAAEFTVTADPAQYLSVDGEVVTQTPVHFSVARQALKILAPRDRADLV